MALSRAYEYARVWNKYPQAAERKTFMVHENDAATTVIMVNMDGEFFHWFARDYTPLFRAMEKEMDKSPDAAVYVVSGEADATAILSQHDKVERFVYIAHGVEPGEFKGMTPEISLKEGMYYPQISYGVAFSVNPLWQELKARSLPETQIELISCQVGKNREYLSQLAKATECDVTAYAGYIFSNSLFLYKPNKVVVSPS